MNHIQVSFLWTETDLGMTEHGRTFIHVCKIIPSFPGSILHGNVNAHHLHLLPEFLVVLTVWTPIYNKIIVNNFL